LGKQINRAIIILQVCFNASEFIERIHVARAHFQSGFKGALGMLEMSGSLGREPDIVQDLKVIRISRQRFAESRLSPRIKAHPPAGHAQREQQPRIVAGPGGQSIDHGNGGVLLAGLLQCFGAHQQNLRIRVADS
jgi:hypothetical protein